MKIKKQLISLGFYVGFAFISDILNVLYMLNKIPKKVCVFGWIPVFIAQSVFIIMNFIWLNKAQKSQVDDNDNNINTNTNNYKISVIQSRLIIICILVILLVWIATFIFTLLKK